MADGTLRSCGDEVFGELGDGGALDDSRNAPGPVAAINGGAVQISAGNLNGLAVRADGTVWVWGRLPATNSDIATPTQVTGVTNAVAACSGASLIALLADGTVINIGQSAGSAVAGVSNATAIACGNGHYLALRADGTVLGWGRNVEGQVGNGAFDSPATSVAPVAVSGLSGVTMIAAGGRHSLALRNDGTVWSWGFNAKGQLGDGGTANRNLAAPIASLSSNVRIAAGGQNSMALRSGGTLFAWGSNGFFELGNGTFNTAANSTPAAVPGLSGVTDMAVGFREDRSTAFAVLADGSVRGWGNNTEGQACVGSNNPGLSTPQVVPGLNVN